MLRLGLLSRLLQPNTTGSQLPLSKPHVAMAMVVTACLYSVGVSTLVLCVAGLLLALMVLTHHPLVPGMRRTAKVHLALGLIIGYRRLDYLLSKWRGEEPFPYNMASKQFPIIRDTTKPAPSAKSREVKVTREEMAGVPVIVYRPHKMSSPTPAMVFMRGAGFVCGSADLFDKTAYEYAKRTNIMVVLVNCCQAPQNPFPEPFNQNLQVTRHVLEHGADLDIDVNSVGVGGDSAGAQFAAAVATDLSMDETGELPSLKFQVLQVPVTQCLDMRLPSYQDFHTFESFVDSRAMAVNFAYYMGFEGEKMAEAATILLKNAHHTPSLRDSNYSTLVNPKLLPERYQKPLRPLPPVDRSVAHDAALIDKIASLVTDPRMSPLLADDPSRLPPTFIEVAEFDNLRDDGLLYARRLRDAGVEVDVLFTRNGFHCDAVKILPDCLWVDTGLETLQAATDFVKKILQRQNEP